jgi:hypothetical protein
MNGNQLNRNKVIGQKGILLENQENIINNAIYNNIPQTSRGEKQNQDNEVDYFKKLHK